MFCHIPLPITPIRLVIADDHVIFRKGLHTILQQQKGLHLVAQAANGKELLEAVKKEKPDIVLTDIQMPQMNGIEATRVIREAYPFTQVIAISMFENETALLEMLQAGARGYLLKNIVGDEVVQAIHTVYNRGTYYCSTTSNKLVRLMARTKFDPYGESKKITLSQKEISIIRLLCQEYSSKEIAAKLRLNCRSVESTRERLQEKIGAKNMVGIALYAVKNGIIPFE